MTWIEQLLQQTRESEAPSKFFYWAGLSAISAAVRKNIYLERYIYKLYPNIFVFIVAGSGLKKGVPVVLCKKLVEEASCTRVIAGRNSIQSVIKELSKAYSLEDGRVVRDAQGYLVSGELASFLVKDPDALTILTDIYDTHAYEKEWVNSLKASGIDRLRAPCLTLLGATNEEHFGEAVADKDVKGGFIARTFIVYSDRGGRPNSLTEPPEDIVDVKSLACVLRNISKLSGEMIWDRAAKDAYNKWYYPFREEKYYDPTGTMNRIGDSILKVAMLLALSESCSLVMETRHVEEAIDSCTDCLKGMKVVTMGAGQHSLARGTRIILKELLSSTDNKVERRKLLERNWEYMDSYDLDRIIETLESMGHIEVLRKGKEAIYQLKKHVVEQFKKIERSIM